MNSEHGPLSRRDLTPRNSPMDESLQQWFIREILVHEHALVRFLTRLWPDTSEIDDLCHDTYVRVYESAAKALPKGSSR